jgi:hypothetical protein
VGSVAEHRAPQLFKRTGSMVTLSTVQDILDAVPV